MPTLARTNGTLQRTKAAPYEFQIGTIRGFLTIVARANVHLLLLLLLLFAVADTLALPRYYRAPDE